ncbi:hypothetical protein LUZ60_016716 [Juncus effusus]|nr:hypothetical protein LUZ60_016716 [Juncus effusus]
MSHAIGASILGLKRKSVATWRNFPILRASFTEMIRSVHVYKHKNREGTEECVEKEFIFSPESYQEIFNNSLLIQRLVPIGCTSSYRPRFFEGQKIGLWDCIFAYDSTERTFPSTPIIYILSPSENAMLKYVPSLLNDLQKVLDLEIIEGFRNSKDNASQEISNSETDDSNYQPESFSSESPSFSISNSQENQQDSNERKGSKKKARRASTKKVKGISKSDLEKCFNLSLSETSKALNIGITVLKRKCREFGIKRWPNRKIKSLDSLITNLEEEVSRREKENQMEAVKAVLKRKKMLENERKAIERSPSMDLKEETKRFRQDIFKRRHLAKSCKLADLGNFSN